MVPRFWKLAQKLPAILGRTTRPTTTTTTTTTTTRTTVTKTSQPRPAVNHPASSTTVAQPSSSSLRAAASLTYLSSFTPPPSFTQPWSSFNRPSSSMAYHLSSTTRQPSPPPTISYLEEILPPDILSSLFPPLPDSLPPLPQFSSPNSTNNSNSNTNTMNDEDAELFLTEDLPIEVVRLLCEAQAAFLSFRSTCGSSGSGEDQPPTWDFTTYLQTLTAMILAFDALRSHGLVVAETIKDTFLRLCGIKDEIPQDPAPEPKPQPQGEAKPESAEPGPPQPDSKPAEPKPPNPKPPQPDSKPAEPPKPPEKQPPPPPAEPEQKHNSISFTERFKSPNRVKYVFLVFGVTEEDNVVAEVNGKGQLSVKASFGSGPDMENTTATLSLPPGEWCLSRTKVSVKNGVFLVELKGSQLNKSSSSSAK